jgi:hypothetical protein
MAEDSSNSSTWGGTQRNNGYLPQRTQDWFNPLQHMRHTADMLGAEPDKASAAGLVDTNRYARGQGDPNQTATAAALGYQGEGAGIATRAAGGARVQRAQANGVMETAGIQAREQNQLGQDFQTSQQAAALGYQQQGQGVAGRQGDPRIAAQAAQGTDTSTLRNFYQQGPGPSAAQAQLQAGQDASMGQALAMARSGRNGTNAAAERQAMFQNAATNQQTNQAAAGLRANEEAAWRGQQLGAITAEQQAQAQGRGQQLQALGYGLQERAQSDQTALGYGQLASQTQGLALQGGLGYGQLANQTQGLGQQYSLGAGGLANQREQFGGQLGLGYQQLGESTMQNEADRQALAAKQQADLAFEAQKANIEADAKRAAGNRELIGKVLGGMALSDERNKTAIVDDGGATATGGDGGDFFSKYAAFFGGGGNQQQEPEDETGYESMGNGIAGLMGGGGGGMMGGGGAAAGGGGGMMGGMMSDAHSKERIQELESELERTYAALGGRRQQEPQRARSDYQFWQHSPETAARGDAQRRASQPAPFPVDGDAYKLGYRASYGRDPGVDLRPARGYSYEYKDPSAPGAAPGRHFGPMAQDLERTPAGASTVRDTPNGKIVDTERLTMVNTAALSEQQRRTEELERELEELRQQKAAEFEALGGASPRPKARTGAM